MVDNISNKQIGIRLRSRAAQGTKVSLNDILPYVNNKDRIQNIKQAFLFLDKYDSANFKNGNTIFASDIDNTIDTSALGFDSEDEDSTTLGWAMFANIDGNELIDEKFVSSILKKENYNCDTTDVKELLIALYNFLEDNDDAEEYDESVERDKINEKFAKYDLPSDVIEEMTLDSKVTNIKKNGHNYLQITTETDGIITQYVNIDTNNHYLEIYCDESESGKATTIYDSNNNEIKTTIIYTNGVTEERDAINKITIRKLNYNEVNIDNDSNEITQIILNKNSETLFVTIEPLYQDGKIIDIKISNKSNVDIQFKDKQKLIDLLNIELEFNQKRCLSDYQIKVTPKGNIQEIEILQNKD